MLRQADDLNSMVSEIRSYYSRNVVGRVQANAGVSVPSHNYEEFDGGIPIPATLSIELGKVIGDRAEYVSYRFVSDEPFKGRTSHNLDAFELRALAELRSGAPTVKRVTEVNGSLLSRQVKMAVPVVMGTSCVACHN